MHFGGGGLGGSICAAFQVLIGKRGRVRASEKKMKMGASLRRFLKSCTNSIMHVENVLHKNSTL